MLSGSDVSVEIQDSLQLTRFQLHTQLGGKIKVERYEHKNKLTTGFCSVTLQNCLSYMLASSAPNVDNFRSLIMLIVAHNMSYV